MRKMCILLQGASLLMAPPGFAADGEQVQGSGGTYLHYSSSQLRVDCDAAGMADQARWQDAVLALAPAQAFQATQRALPRLGYQPLDQDADFNLIRADKDEVLVSEARQVLRGLLKMKLPLPGKPDHQTTELLLSIRPAGSARESQLRLRLQRTVWDSNGNARTMLCGNLDDYRRVVTEIRKSALGM
ncbi:hypothetical protein [Paludibacterium sp.]|uniref:hypothetical protein n=1 Tax=Paludibacterium sp. TaxID=1917523 RepID=UPI0025DDCDA0|nr:hypothetical protein [Paludibacterium sp.]MBV8648167.1 hypothetical protein [Paludibacterium sp.]